ncbi:MAG TPA: response regulator, partial [Smithellaceae bacterium]|nr:response regulator [Smithellaceae bacterium]
EETEPQGNERILFIDDEESLVTLARAFFESRGYRITATVNSLDAFRLFQKNPDGFDLVITDMTMPEITGAELVRAFLKIRADIPIILCTGYSDSISVAEVRKLKIREFVLKPVALNDLGRLVRRVLDS